MEVEELKIKIRDSEPRAFCVNDLFNDSMWLFDSNSGVATNGDYKFFRQTVSSKLNLAPPSVALVGSAKFGYSLNPRPEKTFKPFGEESDLDVVIVDDELFSSIWKALRDAYYNGYWWIKKRHQGDVFRRFVLLLGEESYKTTYLRKTSRLMDEMAVEVGLKTGISRTLKYRIYADWDAAIEYHTNGIQKLQRYLNGNA